jgi:hypothetical protein
MQKSSWIVVVCLLLASVSSDAAVVGGWDRPAGRDAGFRVTVGSVTEIRGTVQETTRRFYDLVGREEDQADAENFSFDDFGMDDGYGAIGFSYDNSAKYFAFQMDALFLNPEATAIAKRNYYIGVSEVDFNGKSYEHMKIPEGQEFTLDMITSIIEIRTLWAPLTFKRGDSLRVTPFLNVGLFMFLGQYDIDAGPARGVVQYQEPPEDFVIGGQASGTMGLAMPEVGAGLEVRIGKPEGANLVLHGNCGFIEYDGNTGWLTSSSDREKDVDLSHSNIKARAMLEIPRKEGKSFTFGVEYRSIESDASITSQDVSDAEAIARRERFDKDVEFKLTSFVGMVGMTF